MVTVVEGDRPLFGAAAPKPLVWVYGNQGLSPKYYLLTHSLFRPFFKISIFTHMIPAEI